MQKAPFQRLMIANRGEIAIRIARAASELGIRTIGIYAHEDRFSIHRYKTDESYKIGEKGKPLAAYLDSDALVKLARSLDVDALHPGYGFLSENAELARKCAENGIVFIGPTPNVLEMFGDKVAAKETAVKAGLTILPGSSTPLRSVAEAKDLAARMGYPVMLKAISGGGGKGIRLIQSPEELEESFVRSQSEAKSNFGHHGIYLEKTLQRPKHIEVQILGDTHGNLVHLFERDCSIQRRNQKVVEVAPALAITEETRHKVCQQAVALMRSVNYRGLGTVEFLVNEQGESYFLEVNPRVQVEHTVTEMITGVDLLQASILVAAGYPLSHPSIGITQQEDIVARGTAIQCRITTEDPLKNFSPDTGKIIAYRPAGGFGIRLDEGFGTAGGEVTPYYDSLLVKVTAWGRDLPAAAAKMHRSLAEFRIRGVKHNISLLKNIMTHPQFLASSFTTDFFSSNPDVFVYRHPRDRATKLLRYIAEVSVNDPHDLQLKGERPCYAEPLHGLTPEEQHILAASRRSTRSNPKDILRQHGPQGVVKWIKEQKHLLLTDTTMRDAHQSLFATRLRTRDMMQIAPFYAEHAQEFFSLEVWGGATFDTALRFLKEDPWVRLAKVRQAVPNILLQMLLRGDNAVGYTNYPRWVITAFIEESVKAGIDVFRIFDCFNQLDKMQIALEAVKKHGAIAELSVCYTGDIIDPKRSKYDLKYYVRCAKDLARAGADILCIKDMAGLLKPHAARLLIKALRQEIDLPIHLHTHDTSGAGVAMLLAAAEEGCSIVDGAISSMAGLTSQPSLNALIASLSGKPNQPTLSLAAVDYLARYWEGVRKMYEVFDPGIRYTSTDVYQHEIPGGQFSNLYEQAKKVGLTAQEFFELTMRYKEVNQVLGDLIKVTPSSKVVGDMALLLHKAGYTGERWLREKPQLDYPDSLISFLKGHMGVPYGGFDQASRELVLGPKPPAPENLSVDESEKEASVQQSLTQQLGRSVSRQEVLSYRLYPKVFKDFVEHCRQYGNVTSKLPTDIFFYGLSQGREFEVDLEPGKTLIISLKGISEGDAQGKKIVFFHLNGFDREIAVVDRSLQVSAGHRPLANGSDPSHIAATMPGKVIDILVRTGDAITKGQVLFITEAMKMEYTITAKIDGTVKELFAAKGDMVASGELLATLS